MKADLKCTICNCKWMDMGFPIFVKGEVLCGKLSCSHIYLVKNIANNPSSVSRLTSPWLKR